MIEQGGSLLITPDDPQRDDVVHLLREHLSDMHLTSPAESVHALDPGALSGPGIAFFSARRGDELLGIGALRTLTDAEGEIKSMRTATSARGLGVGAAMVARLLDHAAGQGMSRVSLETGSQEYFAPARRLYVRLGFVECGPFGSYLPDPHSRFFTATV